MTGRHSKKFQVNPLKDLRGVKGTNFEREEGQIDKIMATNTDRERSFL